jgi:hypothetical protein
MLQKLMSNAIRSNGNGAARKIARLFVSRPVEAIAEHAGEGFGMEGFGEAVGAGAQAGVGADYLGAVAGGVDDFQGGLAGRDYWFKIGSHKGVVFSSAHNKVNRTGTQALFVRTIKIYEQEGQTRPATAPGGLRKGSTVVLPTTRVRSGGNRGSGQNREKVQIRVDSGDSARRGTPRPEPA